MNRTEKNQQMQDLILQNAIVEFARSGYENVRAEVFDASRRI